ncbi:signal recognition particle protein [Candidatus Dependentiae bacterium]|nr:signal recognition particle protein [Candidatus Dependentiae bacterium]
MFNFLSQKFSGILSWVNDKGKLTEQNVNDAMQQVKEALLDADVPLNVADDFLKEVQKNVVGEKIHQKLNAGQTFIKIVHDKLLEFLGGKNSLVLNTFQIPSVIMVMGLQGSGKTTTIAKIANFISKQAQKKGKKRRILLASVDFYRPAAVEQLQVLAQQVGVDFYQAQYKNPIDAAAEIYNFFKKNSYELLFLDTAGRLHIDNEMIKELVDIDLKISPKYKVLILDAMTGQESLNVARAFDQAVGFHTAILSKMDSDARGGAAFAFKYCLKKSISFVGSGEKIDDLESFVPDRMTTRILGMGDILSLIEKAEENIDTKEQEVIAKKMMSGGFTLKDFAKQMDMINSMGSFQKIMKYLPGMGGVSDDLVEKSKDEMKKFRAIISSMNKKEQIMPEILNGSRKQRIAKGAGVQVQDVNQLLQKFEQSKRFVKMAKNKGQFRKFF